MTTRSPWPAAPAALPAARLRPADLAALASVGLRTRKLRATLSALGIAIGVAAIVAVLGLAASAKAELLAEIQALGTNLLTVTNGQSLTGATAELPEAAPGMIARLPGVTGVQDTGAVGGVNVYKSPLIPPIETNALSVYATTLGLPAVSGTSLAQGRFLNAATAHEPVAVLGAVTAQLLGIDRIRPGMRIWAGGQWFYVTGILNKDTYAPQIDTAVLVGFPAAEKYLHFDGHPSEIYVRTASNPAVTTAVDGLLGARPARKTPARSPSPSPRTRSPPRPTPRAHSTPCSSAWARSRCWSARSGWPTSWSSRCWNAAPRSGCAGRWAPPAARSAPSSSPRRSCCPWPAAPLASLSAPPPPSSTPAATARPSLSPPTPGPAAWPPPSSSAPWPGSSQPYAPRACPRHRHS